MTLLLLRFLGPLLIIGALAGKFALDGHRISTLTAELAVAQETIKRQSDAAAALVAQVQTQNRAVEAAQHDAELAQAVSTSAVAKAQQGAQATAQRLRTLETARTTPGHECQDAKALIEAAVLGAQR